MRGWIMPLASLVLLLALGCNQEGRAESAKEEKHYTLEVKAPPPGKIGQEGELQVLVKAKEGWKVNKDYPHKLTITPPKAVEAAPSTLTRKEAVMSESSLTFKSRVKATTGGKHMVEGRLKSSVCSTKLCDLVDTKISFSVEAQ